MLAAMTILTFVQVVMRYWGLVLLGIIMVVITEIGMISPTVGLNLFVTSGITGMSLVQVTRAALPWLSVLLLFLVIITYEPQVALFLPNMIFD
ncbi:MAG: TRAP transporter large permease subunit [Burkholderiaceae bacterium]